MSGLLCKIEETNKGKRMVDAKDVFNKLDKYRDLPKYQLERRSDIFFVLYLEQVLSAILEDECKIVLPEFPLRALKLKNDENWEDENLLESIETAKTTKIDKDTGSLKESNASTNVDYLVWGKKSRTLFFIELKTDSNSFDAKQYWYYRYYSEKKTFGDLLEFLKQLCRRSQSGGKYIEALKQLGVALEAWDENISPASLMKELDRDELFSELSKKVEKVKTIYIAPEGIRQNKTVKKMQITFDENNLITLTDFRDKIKETDEFSKRFKESLKTWDEN